jgi:hypothetical protein
MSDSKTEKAIRQFVAVFRRMLSTGRQVAAEDAARAVKTDDDFDRVGAESTTRDRMAGTRTTWAHRLARVSGGCGRSCTGSSNAHI